MATIKARKVMLRGCYEKFKPQPIGTLKEGDKVTLLEERLYFSGDPVGHAYYKVKTKGGQTGYIRQDAIDTEIKRKHSKVRNL